MNMNINLIIDSIDGRGGIYLSNNSTAKSLATLKKYNIGAIISLTKQQKLKHSKQDVPKYLYIQIEDSDNENISQYFDMTFEFIEEARRYTNILIHCIAGISRSPTILLAYLIRKYQYSIGTAFDIIKRKRDQIEPNEGFVKQLKKYYLSIKKLKTEKSQTQQPKRQSLLKQPIKSKQLQKSIQFPRNKSIVSQSLQKSKMTFSQMIKSKIMLDDYRQNPKITKKIERLKTSIVTSSIIFNDKMYDNQQQRFSELLKSKIYKNKSKKL